MLAMDGKRRSLLVLGLRATRSTNSDRCNRHFLGRWEWVGDVAPPAVEVTPVTASFPPSPMIHHTLIFALDDFMMHFCLFYTVYDR